MIIIMRFEALLRLHHTMQSPCDDTQHWGQSKVTEIGDYFDLISGNFIKLIHLIEFQSQELVAIIKRSKIKGTECGWTILRKIYSQTVKFSFLNVKQNYNSPSSPLRGSWSSEREKVVETLKLTWANTKFIPRGQNFGKLWRLEKL